MPGTQDLRKLSERWLTTTPPPDTRRLYISVHYDTADNHAYFPVNLDDPEDSQTLEESEIPFIAATLDEVHKRLGIPKGET